MTGTRTKERVQTLGEVFTAPAEVDLMLDMLGPDASDPDVTILEPSCGHGNFLVEILRRRSACLDPVRALKNVIAVDICADNVAEARERMFVVLMRELPDAMTEETQNRVRSILAKNVRVGDFLSSDPESVACDVIVGNPPYQTMDGGFGASARPLYHTFFLAAKAAARRKVCFIMPARWYTGGKGLDAFRAIMLADRSIAKMVDWENSAVPFPGVDISGGVCVVLTDVEHNGDCVFERRGQGTVTVTTRDLRSTDVLIRDDLGASIAAKTSTGRATVRDVARPRNAFGMATNFKPDGAGDVQVLTNSGWVAHPRAGVPKRADHVDLWKVFVSGSAFEHAGAAGKDGKRRVLSRIILAPPGTAATETYILIDAFRDEERARRLADYLSTRFVRYLVSLAAASHHITRDRFRFVPCVDLGRSWDDESLAETFRLTQDERARIADVIRAWPEQASQTGTHS